MHLQSADPVHLDNAHVVQTRLILLDAPLLFFMSVAIFSYVRFYRLRYKYVCERLPSTLTDVGSSEFSYRWWKWLCSTGFFLALTISCKMNGALTFMTIGSAVLFDLWNIIDIRRRLSNVRDTTIDSFCQEAHCRSRIWLLLMLAQELLHY